MSELTPELIAELRRLERESNRAPWRVSPTVFGANVLDMYGNCVAEEIQVEAHAHLFQAMRNALPALLNAAEAHLAEGDAFFDEVEQEIERGARPVPPEKRFKP